MKNSFFLTIEPQKKSPKDLRSFEPAALRCWLDELPTANYGMTARALHERINQLNGIEANALFRLEALELMRPSFLMIQEYLRARISSTGFPLGEDEQKIGGLLAQITRNLSTSYWLVVRDLTQKTAGWFQNKHTALAIQRVMGGLSGVLLTYYLMALPVPNWVWLDLHSLYRLAREKKKDGFKVKDEAFHLKHTSIENTYKQILLVSLADPCGLLQKEILELYAFSEKLAGFVELESNVSGQGARCVLLTEEDKPPMWLETDKEYDKGSTVYQVMLGKLIDHFKKHPDRVENPGVVRFGAITASEDPAELLAPEFSAYLTARWSGRPLRGDACFQDRQDRLFSIGLKATHSHLAPIDSSEAAVDEWLVESASDRSLSCAFDQPNQIFIGSLVSFRRNGAGNAQRALGTVCRIHMDKPQGAVRFEVHVLTPQVYAVGTQSVTAKDPKLYQRTLLYVGNGQVNRTCIILESQKLKDGDVIRLLMQNDSFPIQLQHRQNVSLGYWQFECARVVQQQNSVEMPKKGYDFV
ncbi:MAG: hypothetical protein ABFS02_07215 [Pseudomonadota bacterium]